MSQPPVILFLCDGRHVALRQKRKAPLESLNCHLLADTDPAAALTTKEAAGSRFGRLASIQAIRRELGMCRYDRDIYFDAWGPRP